jgi:hypothetical protein
MNVPSTSPLKGASRASVVYAGKNKVRYFLNTPRISVLWLLCFIISVRARQLHSSY